MPITHEVFLTLTKASVGLSNVDNTADMDKPVSTAMAAALAGKQDTLVSGTNIKTINGATLLGSGDITISSGITVGTTTVTGGTTGGVFYQSGGVVSQSGNLSFNGVQLDIYAALRVQVSAGLYIALGSVASANRFTPYSTGTPTRYLDTTNLYGNLGLGALSVGGVGYADVLAPTGGAIFQGSVSIGATAAASKLDLRAQGALSTDVVFRVRNSSDTGNLFEIRGNGTLWARGANPAKNDNCAFGEQALDAVTSGGANVAFGLNALTSLTTGAFNSAFGDHTLISLTTNGLNNAFGSGALRNTTGAYNSAFGSDTLGQNTSGQSNAAFGVYALASANASNNSAFGTNAMYSATSGANNIAMGYDAGRRITAGGANQTSNNSVYLGYDTRASANGNTNEIVIGYSTIGNGSNTVTLGNTSITKTLLRGTVNMAGIPTSSSGLSAGDIWNNSGVLNIV